MSLSIAQIIESFEGYNNTFAWYHDGFVYIDSLKVFRVWDGKPIETLNLPTDERVLFGIDATDMVFGGRKTICNVFRVPV